jgi:4-diphosphocytidyl-2-C-methyl-D-erythritol kinase
VEVRAPAKLTLSLRIDGVRDDGYHLIDAEMTTLDLHDTLLIGPGDGLAVTGAVHAVDEDDDLVIRALRLVDRTASVELDKRIPAGAGLGGGSADAAAVLRWAGWTDRRAAGGLGADVPFCLVGGRARVRGIGDVVESLDPRPATFTLLTPPVRCPTAAVYATWDRLGGPRGDHGNDLEPAAVHLVPELATWRDRLAEATGRRPRLAGSGSTWFVEGAFPGGDRVVAQAADVRGDPIDGSTAVG